MLIGPTDGQRLRAVNRPDIAAMRTASFGPLIPFGRGATATIVLPMHVSVSPTAAASGYQIRAVASLAFTPAGLEEGGKSMTASDIGVGITSVSSALGANPHMTIASGFDYDPANVDRKNGSSPFSGAAAGRATLTDLLAGREVLRVEKMSGSKGLGGTAGLDLTLKLAMVPQFFTPGGFSGTIILTVVP
jgi:hypothetical protein